MEVEVSGSETSAIEEDVGGERGREQLLDKRRALVAALEQCQRALELIRNTDDEDAGVEEEKDEEGTDEDSSSECGDSEMAQLCDLLKSRVESINFLEKIENIQASVSQNSAEEASSWDMVSENDLWEGGNMDDDIESGPEGYVLVRQEDILEGVACFMATFLLSLDQTKDFTPNQLQEVLSKTFSVKKKKGKLQKAWNGSKVIYNAASWGATAIGIYQNPALFSAASVAFGTSCRVISRFF